MQSDFTQALLFFPAKAVSVTQKREKVTSERTFIPPWGRPRPSPLTERAEGTATVNVWESANFEIVKLGDMNRIVSDFKCESTWS